MPVRQAIRVAEREDGLFKKYCMHMSADRVGDFMFAGFAHSRSLAILIKLVSSVI